MPFLDRLVSLSFETVYIIVIERPVFSFPVTLANTIRSFGEGLEKLLLCILAVSLHGSSSKGFGMSFH